MQYLILLFPMLFELVTDYRRIVVRHKEDNHAADIPVRIAMCIAVGFLCHWLYDKHVIQGLIYSGTMFMLFDPLLNLARGKHFFYKGQNFTDKLWSQTPPHAEILVRLWFLSVGFACYYYWDLIVS